MYNMEAFERDWEREFLREERRLKRMRTVFIQKLILFLVCPLILCVGLVVFLFNSLKVEAESVKEPITIQVESIKEPLTEVVAKEINFVASPNKTEEIVAEVIYEEEVVVSEYVYNISDEDKLLFKQIISAEAYDFWSESDCLSLATVVINRLHCDTFPDSIREILTADLQFETYSNGRYLEVPISASADAAVEAVLKGETNLNSDVMYFCTTEYYSVCPEDKFFKRDLDEPVYQVRNVLFFEEPKRA